MEVSVFLEHLQPQMLSHTKTQVVSIENTCTTFELVIMNFLKNTAERVLPTVGSRQKKTEI
jgi:hypothetical protein